MAVLSLCMMSIALLLEGAMLWIRDGVTRDLPRAFLASDLIWFISLLGLLCFWRHPWVTVVSGWALLLSLAVVLAPFYEHTPGWFLYRHSVEIATVAFAHLGLYFRRQQHVKAVKHGPAIDAAFVCDHCHDDPSRVGPEVRVIRTI